ncbi:MAG: hypothetical protein ABI547_02250, partial [Betaproteobacteria bacterium]
MRAAHVARAWGIAVLTLVTGYGCMTANRPAPVSDRTQQSPAAAPAVAKPTPTAPPAAIVAEVDPNPEFY